jgi:polysaccharide export outer membrane protein
MSVLFLFLFPGAMLCGQELQKSADVNTQLLRLAQLQSAAHDYLIGPDDVLQITVFEVPEISGEHRVSSRGELSLPLLPGKILAAGLTAAELETKLEESLRTSQLVNTPQVSVSVKEYRSHPITVVGAVRTPTVYQAVGHTSLLEVLARAGGLAEDAGSTVVITQRALPPLAGDPAAGTATDPGAPASRMRDFGPQGANPSSETRVIRLKDLLESGDPRFNVPVEGGDTVSVPRAGIVYVVGAVNRPGGFVLKDDREEMSVLKALALAEDLKSSALRSKAVIVRKDSRTGQSTEIPVDLSKILGAKGSDPVLQANDILFVPDSGGKRALRRAAEAALQITTGIVIFRR